MKAYVKPELVYERYELSQHVAACVFKPNISEGQCQYIHSEAPGISIFTTELSCTWPKDSIQGSYCITASSSDKVTFNS